MDSSKWLPHVDNLVVLPFAEPRVEHLACRSRSNVSLKRAGFGFPSVETAAAKVFRSHVPLWRVPVSGSPALLSACRGAGGFSMSGPRLFRCLLIGGYRWSAYPSVSDANILLPVRHCLQVRLDRTYFGRPLRRKSGRPGIELGSSGRQANAQPTTPT
ncbi:hypothetical protein T265_09498 [Opisthorchis viverrini]|uniref:Uncharacterized protein n=1 Tax=Opisthorchis viverrini TaxID=6198 RepID=A0A075A4S4_OPIVI|nr:hypothetical protein T265_09498 [Opisthorchis viverrini]KER22419.1 hypothetical protein T265_09498 [Opisthorchis viverrini]